VRQLGGYLRYDTQGELLLLNKIWALQSMIGNHFYPQQKLVSKVRDARERTDGNTATHGHRCRDPCGHSSGGSRTAGPDEA